MISKNKIKFLRSLQIKKNRENLSLFTVEGEKIVDELLRECPHRVEGIYTTDELWLARSEGVNCEKELIKLSELKQISSFTTPQSVLAAVRMPDENISSVIEPKEFVLALDRIQDPGNLGTIIRLSDWYGIDAVICSPDTVDCYNPKTIQSTMGSIFRIPVFYKPLAEYLSSVGTNTSVYGAFLEGDNLYATTLNKPSVLVMGNESQGISPEVAVHVRHRITIPSFAKSKSGAESLNVAMATAIFCSEFRRR